MTKPIVRFAPSPTGRLHIGNARPALMNALFARRQGGTFILRFDDTDLERSRREYADSIEVDLAWLGIPPDIMVRQSDRVPLYDAARQKLREAGQGFDGTWVAHPDLVPVAREVFDRLMPTPNQIHVKREDVSVTAADLLAMPKGAPTEQGARANINIGLQYLEAWLRGVGCVPIFNLMEDAATAEISRAQIWQWLRHGVKLADGRVFTRELYAAMVPEELGKIRGMAGEKRFAEGKFAQARALFDALVLQEAFQEFLTLKAYDQLTAPDRPAA